MTPLSVLEKVSTLTSRRLARRRAIDLSFKKDKSKATTILLNQKMTLIKRLILFINAWFLKVQTADVCINYWLGLVQKWQSTKGNHETIRRVKATHLLITKYLCGEPLLVHSFPIKTLKDGLPAHLGPIGVLVRSGDINSIRLALTLMKVSRTISGIGSPDLTPIETKTQLQFKDWTGLVSVIKELNLQCKIPKWSEPHFSTKSGPNGQALLTSLLDLTLLPDSLLKSIYQVGGEALKEYINNFLPYIKSNVIEANCKALGLKPKGLIRRLALVQDPEAKCRIVGILDYWSQTALKPLHDHIMTMLGNFKADCTRNQGHFITTLPKNGPYWSLDLSKATDSFSVEFQEKVLSIIFSDDVYASSWRDIMTNYAFYCPWEGRDVWYRQGQPMGAYSSWAVFSLCHHLLVQLSAKRAGLTLPFNDYALLGDDIVLTNGSVVKHYQELINSVGGTFSKDKSHTSSQMYEFAKRWFLQGVEVTGAPIRPFLTKEKYTFLTDRISDLISRWQPGSDSTMTVGLLFRLYSLFHPPFKAEGWANKGYNYWLLPKAQDSGKLATEKRDLLERRMLNQYLGCNRTNYRPYMESIMNSVKSKLVIKALKGTYSQMPELNALKPGYMKSFNGIGIDRDWLVGETPIFKSVAIQISKLETFLDPNTIKTIDDYLALPDLKFNPLSTFELRRHEQIVIKLSKLSRELGVEARKQLDLNYQAQMLGAKLWD